MKEDHQKVTITMGSWFRGALVVAIAAGVYMVGDLLLAILTAIVIATAMEPVAIWARKKNIPRLPTILSVYVMLAVVLAGLFYFVLLPFLDEVSGLIRTLSIYTSSSVDSPLFNMFESQKVFGDLPSAISMQEVSTYLNSLTNFLSQGVFSSISLVFGGVLSFVLIVVLSFYLAVQEDGVGKFLKIITPVKHEGYVVGLWRRSQRKIGLWMQGQLILGAIVMILVYAGLTIIGVEHALLLAVLAGVFELIPLFGPILAAIPAMFLAFIAGGTTDLFIVAGLYLVIQQLENHVIYPLVVKKVVGVPPMVSILALLIGAQLAGFLGILISVPIAAAIMELFNDLEQRKVTQFATSEDLNK